jgi:phosphoenolpyruvate carboxykinase (GTP)
VPDFAEINWQGMPFEQAGFERLMAVDKANSKREFEDQATLFASIGPAMPVTLEHQRQAMLASVQN